MPRSVQSSASNNTAPVLRRGRPRRAQSSRTGIPQSTPTTRRRAANATLNNPFRATAARTSRTAAAGRRTRRLANRPINSVESLALINNYFADCEYSFFGCQQQLGRLGRIVSQIFENSQLPRQSTQMDRNMQFDTQLFGVVNNGEENDYQQRGELPVLLRNVRFVAENRGEDPWETFSHLVRRRNAVEEHDELARVGPPLEAPPMAAEVDVRAGGDGLHGLITIIHDWDDSRDGNADAGDS